MSDSSMPLTPTELKKFDDLSLLDTPKSLTNEDLTNKNDQEIIRKLGAGEIVYDYELKLKGCILPFSLIFESNLNLFDYKSEIEKSIQTWKSIHPFLCTKILVKKDPLHKFSHERYFSYASKEKIENLDNITYLKLTDRNDTNLWMYLHERELNLEPVNSDTGLLWRILIAQLDSNKYCLILTIHHSIVDGRNGFAILDQLLILIEKTILNQEIKVEKFQPNPSIEEKLYNNDESKLKNLNLNLKYEHSPENKIPINFSFIKSKNLPSEGTFNYLFKEETKSISLSELIRQRDIDYITKFTAFSIDEITLNKLLKQCKSQGSKLTGCLNSICSLATYDLYIHFKNKSLANKICYHFLANLRPFLNIGNLNMGYWPVVFNGIFNTEDIQNLDETFYKEKFWKIAKFESDLIHTRINENEMMENAKLDTLLLSLIDEDTQFENGSVHFALSNLGSLNSSKSSIFNIKELYYNTSCVQNRWSAIVFHGLSSINNTLCWSLGYNMKLIDDTVIDYLVNSIKMIIKNVCLDSLHSNL